MRNKWELFKKRSGLFGAVALWVTLITIYNLFRVFAYHDAFSAISVLIGFLILAYMWFDLEKKPKDYKSTR